MLVVGGSGSGKTQFWLKPNLLQCHSSYVVTDPNGSLYPHLMEVEQTAENRMQQTMAQLLKQNPAPDKEQNQMAWVQHMNSLKAQAEELVLNGTDLQLSFFDAHIPTEVQQIEKIDQAESEKTPSAFSLSQAEIENELRKHGSGFDGR